MVHFLIVDSTYHFTGTLGLSETHNLAVGVCYCGLIVGYGYFRRFAAWRHFLGTFRFTLPLFLLCFAPIVTFAQTQHDDEIVTSLSGGRVILHVAKDGAIFFAAIDQPVEQGAAPPRLVDIDGQHVAILFGASEWRSPADPKPIRMDRNIQRVSGRDSHYEGSYNGEADPDLEIMGTAFLEKLRPLAAQLRRKIDFPADQPIFEMVVIGYGPQNYGPEVWTVEYRLTQELLTTKDNYWQTRVLRPRFTQIYPPEKKAPKVIVESSYPADEKTPSLQTLLEGNDPRFSVFRGDQKMAKALDLIIKGQAQKVELPEAEQFLRAAVPLLYPKQYFFMGKMEEQRGFDWIVAPEEPIEKVDKNNKNQPPEAPSLRKRPTPQ